MHIGVEQFTGTPQSIFTVTSHVTSIQGSNVVKNPYQRISSIKKIAREAPNTEGKYNINIFMHSFVNNILIHRFNDCDFTNLPESSKRILNQTPMSSHAEESRNNRYLKGIPNLTIHTNISSIYITLK